MEFKLIAGDPMRPQGADLIACLRGVDPKDPVPDGWRVISTSKDYNVIAWIGRRHEINSAGNSLGKETP